MAVLDQQWQAKALCRGPQRALFFPPSHFERKEEKDSRESHAKELCAGCPVKGSCLEFAMNIREPHGIWGGTTETERRTMIARIAS
jgi:WhiB family transcriptional regulator, redox-sensing transcriptional regulator